MLNTFTLTYRFALTRVQIQSSAPSNTSKVELSCVCAPHLQWEMLLIAKIIPICQVYGPRNCIQGKTGGALCFFAAEISKKLEATLHLPWMKFRRP